MLPFGARAHKRHVALEHVPQLGQLVEVMAAQELLQAGGIAAVARCHQLRAVLFYLAAHGAKLDDCECPPMIADALLAEKHGAVALHFQEQRDEDERRKQRHQSHGGQQDVRHTLGSQLHPAHSVACMGCILRVHSQSLNLEAIYITQTAVVCCKGTNFSLQLRPTSFVNHIIVPFCRGF